MDCPSCKSEKSEGAKFCVSCGTACKLPVQGVDRRYPPRHDFARNVAIKWLKPNPAPHVPLQCSGFSALPFDFLVWPDVLKDIRRIPPMKTTRSERFREMG